MVRQVSKVVVILIVAPPGLTVVGLHSSAESIERHGQTWSGSSRVRHCPVDRWLLHDKANGLVQKSNGIVASAGPAIGIGESSVLNPDS